MNAERRRRGEWLISRQESASVLVFVACALPLLSESCLDTFIICQCVSENACVYLCVCANVSKRGRGVE